MYLRANGSKKSLLTLDIINVEEIERIDKFETMENIWPITAELKSEITLLAVIHLF